MSTNASRKEIYRRARQTIGLTKTEFARLMCLGDISGNQMSNIGKKEKPDGGSDSKRVSKSDALASGLLVLLDHLGYDVNSIRFNEQGQIVGRPDARKPIPAN